LELAWLAGRYKPKAKGAMHKTFHSLLGLLFPRKKEEKKFKPLTAPHYLTRYTLSWCEVPLVMKSPLPLFAYTK
jgi:hypothetical protein